MTDAPITEKVVLSADIENAQQLVEFTAKVAEIVPLSDVSILTYGVAGASYFETEFVKLVEFSDGTFAIVTY